MLHQSPNSLGAIPRRGRSARSLNAFARRSSYVSKWKVRQNRVLSSSAFSASPLRHEPQSHDHWVRVDRCIGEGRTTVVSVHSGETIGPGLLHIDAS
jgi:hypothetical protein